MNTRILPALKACLTDGLADLHLLGQTAEGDAVQLVQVFIGDLPPPENGRKPFPCVILVPVNGYHEEGGETAVIALICCVYNPEPGDAEGAEQDLAILMSGITRVLGACRETPLDGASSSCPITGDGCWHGKRPKQTRSPSFRRPCCRIGP